MSSHHASPTSTWVVLFPWMERLGAQDLIAMQRLGGPAEWWTKETPAETSSRRSDMDDVFDLLGSVLLGTRTLGFERIGDLLPTLSPSLLLQDVDPDPQRQLALAAANVRSAGELMGRTPHSLQDLLGYPRRGSVVELLGILVRCALSENGASHVADPGAALIQWFGELDDREQDVLVSNLCTDQPRSLSTLAVQHHTLRSRMQEICEALPRKLEAAAADSQALTDVLDAFDAATASPIRRQALLRSQPWLGGGVSGTELTLLSLLLGIRRTVATVGDWLFQGDLEQVKQRTREALSLEPGEVMSQGVAGGLLTKYGVEVEDLAPWLHFCGYPCADGQIEAPQDKAPAEALLPPGDHVGGGFEDSDGSDLDDDLPMTTGGLSTSSAGPGLDGPSVREWAREQGYTVRDRGRIPTAVLEAYEAATKTGSGRAAEDKDEGGDDSTGASAGNRYASDLSDALQNLASYVREHEPQESLGSLLMRADDLPDPFRQQAHQILGAKVSEESWVPAALAPAAPTGEDAGTSYRSLKERALKVLQAAEHPLASQTLASKMGEGVNVRSLKVQLALDQRFVRSDVDAWALAEWGMRPYTTIKDLVEEELDKAGGVVATSELIRILTRDFAINESSLRQVISRPPFTARGGVVQKLVELRSGTDPEQLALADGTAAGPEGDRPDDGPSTDDLMNLMGL